MKREVALLLFAAIVGLGFPASAGAPKKTTKETIHVIYTGGSGAALTNIKEVVFHGLKCLKGKSVNRRSWAYGRAVHIPLDKITRIIKYPSLAEYETAMEEYRNSRIADTPGLREQDKIRDYYFRMTEKKKVEHEDGRGR